MRTSQILMGASRVAGHDDIVAILGSEILSGARQPGSKIPMAEELLQRFGASRVLMREVTKTLVAKGMISAKTRVGTTVLGPEHWNWFDPDVLTWRVRLGLDQEFFQHLAQMRRAVEPAAAALAAKQHTAADLSAMRDALRRMENSANDRRAFAEADLAFHIAVAVASGNPLFRAFAGVVEAALAAYLTLSTPMQSSAMRDAVDNHARIADAIEARDAEAAARAMVFVVDVGLDRVSPPRA